jgi:hypothetical protein
MVNQLAFSPGGDRLAVACEPGCFPLWDHCNHTQPLSLVPERQPEPESFVFTSASVKDGCFPETGWRKALWNKPLGRVKVSDRPALVVVTVLS